MAVSTMTELLTAYKNTHITDEKAKEINEARLAYKPIAAYNPSQRALCQAVRSLFKSKEGRPFFFQLLCADNKVRAFQLLTNWETQSSFTDGSELGSGTMGSVFGNIHGFAIKVFKKQEHAKKEFEIHRFVRPDRCVVQPLARTATTVLYERIDASHKPCTFTNLHPSLTEEQRAAHILNLFKLVAHINDSGVTHYDISNNNVLSDPLGNLRAIDFGLARAESKRIRGVAAYTAPELMTNSKGPYTKSDVYSTAVLALEILCQDPSYLLLTNFGLLGHFLSVSVEFINHETVDSSQKKFSVLAEGYQFMCRDLGYSGEPYDAIYETMKSFAEKYEERKTLPNLSRIWDFSFFVFHSVAKEGYLHAEVDRILDSQNLISNPLTLKKLKIALKKALTINPIERPTAREIVEMLS
ncbi:MAG: protein kinase [Simkaniaceae bacterium]|nr:protein kinase [Simkaniaceae bacterium]